MAKTPTTLQDNTKPEAGSFEHLQQELSNKRQERDSNRPEDGMRLEDIQNPQERLEVPEMQEDKSKLPSIESFFEKTDTEKAQDTLMSEILNTQNILAGQSDFEKNIESELGVNKKSQRLAELRGQMELAEQKFALIEDDVALDSAGRQRSSQAGANIRNQRQRTAQRDYLVLAAQTSAQQGMYDNAKALVQEAVQREYADETLRMQRLETAYKLNADRLGREDTKKQQLFQLKLQEEQREYEAKIQNKERIYQFGLNASANGADSATVRAINNAQTAEEALQIAGDMAISPQLKLQREQFAEQIKNSAFDRDIKTQQVGLQKAQFGLQKQQYYTAQRANQLAAQKLRQDQALAQAQINRERFEAGEDARYEIGNKVNALNDIMGSKGLDASYSTIFGGKPMIAGNLKKESIAELVKMDNLIAKMTFEELGRITENTTLGAISEGEIKLVADSANALRGMIHYNEKNEPQYIKVSPEQFEQQVELVNLGWNRALEKATANQLPETTLNQGASVFQNS